MIAVARPPIAWMKNRADWPVLTQEMRIRQRGVKPFVLMFIYAAVLSGASVFMLSYYAPQSGAVTFDTMSRIGRDLFALLSFAQLVMIALIVPAFSAGAVSTERERGTIDMLTLTMLSSSQIVKQKLAAAIAQAVMLTVASLPVAAVVFLLGGVSPLELAGSYAILLTTAAMLGALGILCSCQFRSTKSATFTAYLVTLAFLIGLPLLGSLLESVNSMQQMSAEGFSFAVAGAFLFIGAVTSLLPYALASAIAGLKWKAWGTRAVRMATFGAIYALVLLPLCNHLASDAAVQYLYTGNGDMFLPCMVNPVYGMMAVAFEDFREFYPIWRWPITGAIAFASGCFFLFRQMAAVRFEAMRRKR